MEYLGERVSIDRSRERVSVVISARLSRGKETLLVTWFLAWLACGAYVAWEAFHMAGGRPRQFLFTFLAFWFYFAVRIGRVVLWRLKGFELVRIKDGMLTIKNSIFGYGRAREYFIENISKLTAIEIDDRSWKHQFNDSFWVMGGERLSFEHAGRTVTFGKGLSQAEVQQLLPILKADLAKARKTDQ